MDGPPTRAELERHYGLLKEERTRLEAMMGVTDRMLESVRRALLREGRVSSPDMVGERETLMSNGSGGEQVPPAPPPPAAQSQSQLQPQVSGGGGGEAVKLRRDRMESNSFGGESVWAVSSSSSSVSMSGSIVLVEGPSS